jgi:hypothetical protein
VFAVRFFDGKMVYKPAPSVKAANHRADNLAIGFGNQEQVGITPQFFEDFFGGVRTANVNSRTSLVPKVEH